MTPKMKALAGHVLCAATALVALSACVYDNDPPRQLTPDAPYQPAPSGSATGGTDAYGATAPSPSTMLVEVDADQTMNAVGGQGVGVFVEYRRGGHWHVWWTCDTKQSGQTCDFSVSATAASGNVSKVDATELAGGFVTSPSSSRLEAQATAGQDVRGVRFDTNPGAVVTIEAAMGGVKDGAFLFFVQGGKVNGGYAGKLTNPLQFQGNAP
jgi:hypothetical protein